MSKFADYLTLLMRDDQKLAAFLHDPLGAETTDGLTKAERTVLRRVIQEQSTNSVNGYRVVRSLDSYRLSVRLLQNVMHQAMASNLLVGSSQDTHILLLYYSGNPNSPTVNPYGQVIMYRGQGNTIGEVMKTAVDVKFRTKLIYNSIAIDGKGPFVESFTVLKPFFGPGVYVAPPTTVLGTPFWFYSLNGRPNPAAGSGADGESYENFPLPSNSVIYWQAIAPSQFGFPPCKVDSPADSVSLMNALSQLPATV